MAVHRTHNATLKRKLREAFKYSAYLDAPEKWATTTQIDQRESQFLDENDYEQ